MDKERMYFACRELTRALCQLVDSGSTMGRDQFHDLCEEERFVDFLFITHQSVLRLEFLNKNSPVCRPEILSYINNALGRHANAVVMEDFLLKNNAYLLALNICGEIFHEIIVAKDD